MTAEILDLAARFEVQLADGASGPPARVTLTLRPCWKKPPVELKLAYVYEAQNIAYYEIQERQ